MGGTKEFNISVPDDCKPGSYNVQLGDFYRGADSPQSTYMIQVNVE